ncbi:hypothetical protein E2C01_008722 [Portunus trituberculatus]|uniref:Uncharacterized protein n=1 Tax=Portunus trituberculatus TaxID=210409 RepID=A0A5B7D1J6_PORTR|nr:hypothetical protein [Portunus trituberculatus]
MIEIQDSNISHTKSLRNVSKEDVPICDFMRDFDVKYFKRNEKDMVLPEEVLAIRIRNQACSLDTCSRQARHQPKVNVAHIVRHEGSRCKVQSCQDTNVGLSQNTFRSKMIREFDLRFTEVQFGSLVEDQYRHTPSAFTTRCISAASPLPTIHSNLCKLISLLQPRAAWDVKGEAQKYATEVVSSSAEVGGDERCRPASSVVGISIAAPVRFLEQDGDKRRHSLQQ